MGSSIFHGAMSTILSLAALAYAESFYFLIFFRTWTGIAIFGFANGFILLPVLMSEIGPMGSFEKKEADHDQKSSDKNQASQDKEDKEQR